MKERIYSAATVLTSSPKMTLVDRGQTVSFQVRLTSTSSAAAGNWSRTRPRVCRNFKSRGGAKIVRITPDRAELRAAQPNLIKRSAAYSYRRLLLCRTEQPMVQTQHFTLRESRNVVGRPASRRNVMAFAH